VEAGGSRAFPKGHDPLDDELIERVFSFPAATPPIKTARHFLARLARSHASLTRF
jgi:hypothetical protein